MADVPKNVVARDLIKENQSRINLEADQWLKLAGDKADPFEETDLYATIEKKEDKPLYTQTSVEEDELNDDIGDLLNRSFTQEKRQSNFVTNIP